MTPADSTTGPSAFAALVRETPLVLAPVLGPLVWIKLETEQETGSFKLRGACRRLDALTSDERRAGVVAASAGNHGKGVASAARWLGIPAHVVVPESAPAVKRDGIIALGASLEVAGAGYDAAEVVARARALERGAVFVSAYDDPWVIDGNGGSLGTEIRRQLPQVAHVICPIGGGGLVAGLVAGLGAGVALVGAQPAANCAMHDSLRLGRALTTYNGEPTFAEGLEGSVAERTFHACREAGVVVELVSERAIADTVGWARRALDVVLEPSAAVALAVARTSLPAAAPRVVVLTGRNIEPSLLETLSRS